MCNFYLLLFPSLLPFSVGSSVHLLKSFLVFAMDLGPCIVFPLLASAFQMSSIHTFLGQPLPVFPSILVSSMSWFSVFHHPHQVSIPSQLSSLYSINKAFLFKLFADCCISASVSQFLLWLSYVPAVLPPGKETQYLLYRRLGGTQGLFGRVLKISPSPGFVPRPSSSLAICYTA